MATMEDRWKIINDLLDDPVADVEPKEALKLIYHAMRYEILEFRIQRLDRRRRKHGTFINDQFRIANFKHDLERL